MFGSIIVSAFECFQSPPNPFLYQKIQNPKFEFCGTVTGTFGFLGDLGFLGLFYYISFYRYYTIHSTHPKTFNSSNVGMCLGLRVAETLSYYRILCRSDLEYIIHISTNFGSKLAGNFRNISLIVFFGIRFAKMHDILYLRCYCVVNLVLLCMVTCFCFVNLQLTVDITICTLEAKRYCYITTT
jgi:hypothetical protein